jgi:hypothetical protein
MEQATDNAFFNTRLQEENFSFPRTPFEKIGFALSREVSGRRVMGLAFYLLCTM